MREIKTLIQQLRNYPNNLFVYPNPLGRTGLPDNIGANAETREGLVVCNLKGEEQGFIEIGTNNGQVVL